MISSQGNGTVPTGTIIWYAASTAPDGFLECNGQSTMAYPALATIVGATVPDLRGEFIRGWDHGRSVDPGRSFGSWQIDMFKSHTHGLTMGYTNLDQGTFGGGTPVIYGTQYTNPTGGIETRPRNVALLPCIKY